MPTLTPYHLTFPHGLHVGWGVANLSESRVGVPSDTLYAALLETWRLTGHEVATLLPDEDAEPPFRLTSAFPFAGGVRFYPIPVDLRAAFTESKLLSLGASKAVKKIRYFSESLLGLARTGQKLDDYLPDESQTSPRGLFLQSGALWLKAEEAQKLPPATRNRRDKHGKLTDQPLPLHALPHQKIWQEQSVPRVTVDRINSSSNLFQSERILFTEGCGLWFGVGQIDDLSYRLDELLAVLGDNGLGGERTAGYGGFMFHEQSPVDFPAQNSETKAYLLNRFHPRQEEIGLLKNKESFYRLEAVDGYLRSFGNAAQRRKRIWLVCEGSLINGDPRGNAPDVRPTHVNPEGDVDHRVYRPGFALAVDWKL